MYREGKRCVIYVRVSTEHQVDGYSLDAQRNTLKRYVEREGMELVEIYEDAGKSGKSIEGRPSFKKMISDIEEDLQIDYILVYKLSRFGRNAADILNSIEHIQSYNVNLISAEEGIDSSQTSGRLLISILSAVSEIERENILEQTMNGRREKARQGGWNGGFAPYGYKLVDGKLEVVEDEAETIKRIFDLYANKGYGSEKMAKEFNLTGYKKKIRKQSTYDRWTARTIIAILDNPIYIGSIAYGRRTREKVKGTKNKYRTVYSDDYILVDNCHEAIIDLETWEKVRESRVENALAWKPKVPKNRVHFLSSILRCPHCGGAMYTRKYRYKGKNGYYKEFFYYVCNTHKIQRTNQCNSNLKIFKQQIEPHVISIIKNLIRNETFLKQVNAKINNNVDVSELLTNKNNIKKQLTIALDNKKRVVYELDNLPLDIKHREMRIQDLNSRLDASYDLINELETRINDLNTRIESVQLGKVSYQTVYDALSNFDTLFNQMNDEEKKESIVGIIDEIHINEEPINNNYINRVKLKFNISNDELVLDINNNDFQISQSEIDNYKENTYYEYIPENYKSCNKGRTKLTEEEKEARRLKRLQQKENKKPNKPKVVRQQKVTYKVIQNYVKEKYNFNVHTSYIAEVKRSFGIDMYDAPNAVEQLKRPRKLAPQNKVIAITDALKHYGIVQ